MFLQLLPTKGLMLLKRWQLNNKFLLQPRTDHIELKEFSKDASKPPLPQAPGAKSCPSTGAAKGGTSSTTVAAPSTAKAAAPFATKVAAPSPAKATSPSGTKATSPSVAKTTAPSGAKATAPSEAKATAPSGAKVTSPSGANATAPSGAKATAPSGAKATSPSGVKATSPSGAKATAPSGAKATAPSRAKATAPSGAKPTAPPGDKATAPCGAKAPSAAKAAAPPKPAKSAPAKKPDAKPPPPPKNMLSSSKVEFGPLNDKDRVFQNLYGRHDWRLKGACKLGDWYRTADLLDMGPNWITEEVGRSGLRGRGGGGGFYVANKWDFMRKVDAKNKILILNCAEGEPGTCKDRELMRHEPHKIIEGCLLAAYAMGCEKCIVYVRNRFYNEACNLQFAIAEAYRYGLIGCNSCDSNIKFEMFMQRGDRYLTGEETALVNCLMGKVGRPHQRPPQLTEKGYFDHPCTVINAESLAVVPTILRRGAKWWTSLGRNKNFGTKLFNISGNVVNPCTVEEEMSIPVRDLIELHAGGVCGGWDNLLAFWPGGLSTSLIGKNDAEDLFMDFDCLENAGSGLGTGGIIVMSKDCDPLLMMQHTLQFYVEQTCKQCTPCRDGSIWLPSIFKYLKKGESVPQMMEFMEVICKTMVGTTICTLSDSQAKVARSLLKQFRPIIDDRILEFAKDC